MPAWCSRADDEESLNQGPYFLWPNQGDLMNRKRLRWDKQAHCWDNTCIFGGTSI
jgi:hypothetical protein